MMIDPGGPPLPPLIPRPQVSNKAFWMTATNPPVKESPVVHFEKEMDLKLTCWFELRIPTAPPTIDYDD